LGGFESTRVGAIGIFFVDCERKTSHFPGVQRRISIAILVLLATFCGAMAQQSASYELSEYLFNLGGVPQDGTEPSSTSYRITLASLGEALGHSSVSGPTLTLDGGNVGSLRPPGEVANLRFDDKTTLAWDPDRSVGSYTAYRSEITQLGSTVDCFEEGITSTSVVDHDPVPGASGFFYIVSASNRIDEGGTLGQTSSGGERSGSPTCP
jgi:hypothetical protein